MCRLYGMRATELTKVECCLIKAQDALLEHRKPDGSSPSAGGWGIACYSDLDGAMCLPELVRHKTAVFASDHFSRQAKSTYAKTVLAHVRMATVGYVGTLNAHPFSYQNWTFAHNGTIPRFEQLQDQLELESGRFQDSRLGATDSEQLFLWLLARLEENAIDLREPNTEQASQVLAEAVAEVDWRVTQTGTEEPAQMTFILTNGRQLFACCFNNPLFRLVRSQVPDCEVCGSPHVQHDEAIDYRAVVFASEPITEEDWQALPNRTICAIDDDEILSYSMQTIPLQAAL